MSQADHPLRARPLDALAPHYDVVVVGSGYGGGVAASRFARMGLRVAVLEQGRLWHPGDFPTTIGARRRAMRIEGRRITLGDPTGLFRMTAGRGMSVFAATGVGGGSLVNAGVVLRPDFSRLRRLGWPRAVLGDGGLADGLSRAEHMLGVGAVPQPERFAKYHGMVRAAEIAGGEVILPRMTISHRAGLNAAGVQQPACRACGDCWSGCNVGAKNTVGVTYLADAAAHGAALFTNARVITVEKAQPAHGENSSATSTGQPRPAWRVGIAATDRRAGHTEHYSVTGDHVVLAAGTLGTNEILMRAADRGLSLSDRLGHGFSANGDDMVFAAELDTPVNAVATGYPSQAPSDTPAVGPHSMAIVDLGDDTAPVWVHDGTMLSVMARIAPFKELAGLGLLRAARMFAGGPWRGELSRTQVYYLVSHDSGEGRIRYARDRVHVDWPEFSTDAQRLHVEKKARDMIEGMGARFKSNPFVLRAFGGNRVIAHPLGGAGLAETAADGVVAPDGQVFNPAEGRAAVHDGLYVADGAAVPTAIGVSPLLTITALAERMSGLAAARLGRSLDLDAATPWPADFKPHAAA